MKRLFFLALIGSAAFFAAAQDAAPIVQSSRNRINADTTSNRSRMVISAKNGSTTERLIDQYSKDGPKGSRTVVIFQSPASVKDTRFLTMEAGNGTNDQWIYLPSLGKVRRIAASEGSASFMGTDLSYDDVSSSERDAGLDTHTLLREEALNGKACYVIESVPKDSSYQYSKMIQWIGKDDKVNYRVELYDRRGQHLKTLEVLELKDIQGRLSVVKSKMSTVAAGTSTIITAEILKYNDPIPEQVFTTSYLETGRAR
jgi:outer membrane lipoprotein-sorting protein